MKRTYQLEPLRVGNMISIQQVFIDGSRCEIARFLLPDDNRWRKDVEFLDDIVAAYKKRLKTVEVEGV